MTRLPQLFLLCLALLVASCVKPQNAPDEDIIVRVGNSTLSAEQLQLSVPAHLLQVDSAASVDSFVNNWVKRQVLHQEAIRLGLHQNKVVRARLREMESTILADALRDAIVNNIVENQPVTDEEVRDYYERNRNQFIIQERYVKVRHLVTNTLDDSRDAKNELMRGAEWESVVERYAVNKEQTLRDARNFFPQTVLFNDNPVMRDYLRVIGISEISPIRGFASQFHFIQLVEERPSGSHPDIDWMFDQIKEWLAVERRRRAILAFEQNLFMQAEANNEIHFFDKP